LRTILLEQAVSTPAEICVLHMKQKKTDSLTKLIIA